MSRPSRSLRRGKCDAVATKRHELTSRLRAPLRINRDIAVRHDPDAFKRVFLAYVAEHGGKCTKPSEIARMYADAWVHALTKTMAVEKPVDKGHRHKCATAFELCELR